MFVGTGAMQTNGNAAELVTILHGGTDSVNDCAWSAFKYAQDRRDNTINGVTWSKIWKMCQLYRKMDPISTSKKQNFVVSHVNSCLIRGPCQQIHVGDLAGSREEELPRPYNFVYTDITQCARAVATRDDGANGATFYEGTCFAEYGADPYAEDGFIYHTEEVHKRCTSCMIWEGQDEETQQKRRKGKKGSKSKRNKKSRPGFLLGVINEKEVPSIPPVNPEEDHPATTQNLIAGPGRQLLGGGGPASKTDHRAGVGLCMWELQNEMLNPCTELNLYLSPELDNKLGYMYGDIHSIHGWGGVAIGLATSLADCANDVATWESQDGSWTGASWHQPDPSLAEGTCWARYLGLIPKFWKIKPGTEATSRWGPQRNRLGSYWQSCVLDLQNEKPFTYDRTVGLLAPPKSTCESQGWEFPKSASECQKICKDVLGADFHQGLNQISSIGIPWTHHGCQVHQLESGAYGVCFWNTNTRGYNAHGQDHWVAVCANEESEA